MIRSESTSAFGQPSDTKPTFGVLGFAAFARVAGCALAAGRRVRGDVDLVTIMGSALPTLFRGGSVLSQIHDQPRRVNRREGLGIERAAERRGSGHH